jgi:hypothetical protein
VAAGGCLTGTVELRESSPADVLVDRRSAALRGANGTETRTTLASQDHVYYEGDSILVVYEPAAPHNAQAVGDSAWQFEEWNPQERQPHH